MAQWAFTVGKFFKRGHMEIKIEWRTADRAEHGQRWPHGVIVRLATHKIVERAEVQEVP